MPDKCPDCPAPSADMDGFIVSGPGGAPRSEGSGVSSPEGPFVREAPQTGHVVIMGTLGADGNPGSLPDAPQVGWAYVAEDAGTYGGVQATEGDMVYCMSLNPVKWGVLQADSDDSGRDLVGVSAEVSCAGWREAEDAELLSACCLRQDDASGTCYGPDSASIEGGVLTVVWKTRWEARWLDMDVRFASGEGHVRVDMSQIHALDYWESQHGIHVSACPPGGCVWNFEDVRARAALESFSGEPDPSASQFERIITASFRLEERPASSLDVYARAADGTSSKSSSPLPCLDAALVSAKADASCAGRIVPAESAKFYINFSTGEANYSEDIDARSGSFVLSGAHVDWAARNYSSNSYVRLSFSVPGEDEDVFFSESADLFALAFNGTSQPGDVFLLTGGSRSYGLVLAERTELTSEDEGGPDVLVRFQIVDAGDGPSVAVVAETLGGDVSVGTADLSCLNDRITSVSAAMDCGAPSGEFSPYSPHACRFYGYDYAGDTPVERVGMDYDLSSSTVSFRWLDDAERHVIVEPDGVPVDVDTFDTVDAPAGRTYEGSSMGRVVRLELVSRTHEAASAIYVFSLFSALSGAVLTLTSVKASGETFEQSVDLSCLVPHVFDGTENGLVPASGAAQNHLLAGDGTWMRPATDAEIDALFAE